MAGGGSRKGVVVADGSITGLVTGEDSTMEMVLGVERNV